MDPSPSVFSIRDLQVGFGPADQRVPVVRGVSVDLAEGESLGVVGESGSGKSVTFLAALGLLSGTGSIDSGDVLLGGTSLLDLPPAQRRRRLGSDLAMVFQNPMTALNPVLSIGAQIVEGLRAHDSSLSKKDAWSRATELLHRVGINNPARRARQYPHEFSGGMCQRAMIAIALANEPRVLIADEPTTAVDVTIQAQLLELLSDLVTESGSGSVLISHDLGVIAENTDRVMVMYGGRVMEQGLTSDVLRNPQHPYTQGLLSCRPSLHTLRRLEPIAGSPPDPATLGKGCPFVGRCPIGREDDRCRENTPVLALHSGRLSACHHSGASAFSPDTGAVLDRTDVEPGEVLLAGQALRREFGAGRLLKRGQAVVAVDGVDLELRPGETLGVVGESGSGKSTVARMMMRLTDATDGEVEFRGDRITSLNGRRLKSFRDRVQIVFQDPFNSLNPKLSVADNAAEPLRLRGVGRAERRDRVAQLFAEVGLGEQLLDRRPGELSGGQLQRVGIARALSVDPSVLILDEPVSALDVSVQAQILNLLQDLQRERELAYLFISHDMAVVRYLCHRVAVMYLGRIVEHGQAEIVLRDPVHPYTAGLLAAVPEVDGSPTAPDVLEGEQSQAAASAGGCSFRPRCPIAVEECATIDPELVRIGPVDAACLVRAREQDVPVGGAEHGAQR